MDDKLLEVAKQAAVEAGQIIARYFGKKHEYQFKNEDKSDFTTQADLCSQEKIVEILTQNFPDHNIIAEENLNIDRGSQYSWVIDPLDGTFAFSRGLPHFAVSVGLLKNNKLLRSKTAEYPCGQVSSLLRSSPQQVFDSEVAQTRGAARYSRSLNKPVLGVIYHVLSKELYFAQKGKGAFKNGQPIFVSAKNNLFDASLAMDFGHQKRRRLKIDLYVQPFLKELGHIFSTGSAAYSLALTACGVQDGTVGQAWIWDFAAGAIIVSEAGGKVTDLAGGEIDWTANRLNLIASNGLIHQALLDLIKK